MIRVALIGYGYAGRTFHAPLIRATPGLGLAVVASSRPERVRADLLPRLVAVDQRVDGAARSGRTPRRRRLRPFRSW